MLRGLIPLHQPQALVLRLPWHPQALSKLETIGRSPMLTLGATQSHQGRISPPIDPWPLFNMLPSAESIPLGQSTFGKGWPSRCRRPNLYVPTSGPSGSSTPGLLGEVRPSQPNQPMASTQSQAPFDTVDPILPSHPQASPPPSGEGPWHPRALLKLLTQLPHTILGPPDPIRLSTPQ